MLDQILVSALFSSFSCSKPTNCPRTPLSLSSFSSFSFFLSLFSFSFLWMPFWQKEKSKMRLLYAFVLLKHTTTGTCIYTTSSLHLSTCPCLSSLRLFFLSFFLSPARAQSTAPLEFSGLNFASIHISWPRAFFSARFLLCPSFLFIGLRIFTWAMSSFSPNFSCLFFLFQVTRRWRDRFVVLGISSMADLQILR